MFKYVEIGVAQACRSWPQLADLTQKQRAEVWGELYNINPLFYCWGSPDQFKDTVDSLGIFANPGVCPLCKVSTRTLHHGMQSGVPLPRCQPDTSRVLYCRGKVNHPQMYDGRV